MTIQWDHQLLNSFRLFLDNQIQSKGGAFANTSGFLYPVSSNIYGLTAYATPYRSLCNDLSVNGANVMTGVYLNNAFVGIGTSGLSKINHELGTVYFTGTLPSNTVISGNYGVKQFNISYSEEPDYKLLFSTKYVLNSKFNQTVSGLSSDTKIAPIIYLKPRVLENKPFAFGRIDENSIDIRAIIIADSQFSKIGVCNILKNLNLTNFPFVTSTPFNFAGDYTGLAYNYSGLAQNSTYNPLVWEAKVIEIPKGPETDNLSQNSCIVDFNISTIMTHS